MSLRVRVSVCIRVWVDVRVCVGDVLLYAYEYVYVYMYVYVLCVWVFVDVWVCMCACMCVGVFVCVCAVAQIFAPQARLRGDPLYTAETQREMDLAFTKESTKYELGARPSPWRGGWRGGGRSEARRGGSLRPGLGECARQRPRHGEGAPLSTGQQLD
jgi:hypothetical protein